MPTLILGISRQEMNTFWMPYGNGGTYLRSWISLQKYRLSRVELHNTQRRLYASLISPDHTDKLDGDVGLHTAGERSHEHTKSLRASPISSVREALFEDKANHEERLMRANWPNDQTSSSNAGDFSDLFDTRRLTIRNEFPLKASVTVIDRLRNMINQHLLTSEDGLQFVTAFSASVKALGCGPTQLTREFLLRTFNSTISRLDKLNIPLNTEIVVQGMACASRARSLAALKYYFNLFIAMSRNLDADESCNILSSLWDWIRNMPNDQKDIHVNQELWRILTGIQDINCPTCDIVRQPCLYKLMEKKELSVWSDYVSIISRIGGRDAIWNEWRRVKIELPSVVINKDTNTKQGSQNKLAAGIIDVLATKLSRAKDPMRAWQLVRESGLKPEMLLESTWNVLFDHPDIDKWEPVMSELVLQKYLEHVERYMGIRWSGGEDGCHLLSERNSVED